MATALLRSPTHRPTRQAPRRFSARLTPLATALALAWQPTLHAAAPAPTTVPVPAANWRVNGTGSSAPVNTSNGQGGTKQTINQTSQRAIYNWQSFDIGANSEVLFNMSQQGASALNRVTGSTAPSQIFGKLTATNKGEIFLVNQNGILFGKGSQVNTGSLIASSLNISDSTFLSGFAESLQTPSDTNRHPAFRYDGDVANFVDSKNFVRVDDGAHITTDSGGRVFLFAKRVDNAGSIQAPGGQVVLGAGGEVFLKLPSSESGLYASETNPAVSAVRGFLVEVGSGPAEGALGHGSASNLSTGSISTPRGNTTIVGMAVNQMGRISATTSVSENGSVILRAQASPTIVVNEANVPVLRATESGAVTLGPGSRIDIAPDASTATSTDSAGFATSHIDIAGRSVEFQQGASIVAPSATVNVRAETTPSYNARLTTSGGSLAAGDPNARIVLGEDVVIDVSGTTTAQRSVADLFVTTELLGSNDLKDAPVQKDGLLYRSIVTLDTRRDSAILGNLDSYRSGIERGVTERLSRGGTVNLRAEGAVLTHGSSSIRVTGGRVGYTGATVFQTQLVADNGSLFDINTAPSDLVYFSALNMQTPGRVQYDRWGRVVEYGTVVGRAEAGYTEGRAAGSVSIAAPVVMLQGELKAGTTVGERQAAGLDKAAHAGSLTIGATVNSQLNFNDTGGLNKFPDAVLSQFTVSASGPSLPGDVWRAPTSASLSDASGMSMSTLASGEFADITIVANGRVGFEHASSQPFHLSDGGSLRLWSGYGDVHLGQSLRGASASVDLLSRDKVSLFDDQGTPIPKRTGSIVIEDGVTVDLRGEWVNQWLAGGLQTTAYTRGGQFSASGFGVELGEGSVIDVSGGAYAALNGAVTGVAAGAITLQDFTALNDATHPTLKLNGELRGYSAASSQGTNSGGGTLTLKTARIVVSNDAADARPDALNLGSSFFDQGGFGSFSLDGRVSLDVAEGTRIAPTTAVRQATVLSRYVASADNADSALADGLAPGLRRAGVNLGLASSGDTSGDDLEGRTGVLTVAQGGDLQLGPQASVDLRAAHRLMHFGRIETHGGQVSMSLASKGLAESNHLWLGTGSVIDVSGTTLYTPDSTDGLLRGSVLAGGTINLNVGTANGILGSLVLQQGARLDARGSTGTLDVTERSAAGVQTTRQQVASAGGAVNIAGNGDLWLEGTVDLHGGSATVAGGSLSVQQLAGRASFSDSDTGSYDPRTLQLVNRAGHDTASMTAQDLAGPSELTGRAVVAADWFNASGASDLRLATAGELRLSDSVELNVQRNLQLVTRGLSADEGTHSHLSAGNLWLGTNRADILQGNGDLQTLVASTGSASVDLSARAGMVLDGHVTTQGIGSLGLQAQGDLRLQSRDDLVGGQYAGGLATQADLTISAAQVYPATDTRFTIDAAGHSVTFQGGDAQAVMPYSAHGSLIVNAARIEQDGVLRAPMGHIELHASEQLHLGSHSVTSVSADGWQILYGQVDSAGGHWTTPTGSAMNTPPDKQVLLDSASVITSAGSLVDVSGGGDLIGTEFIPGKGGSADILAGGRGSYAIVPSHGAALAPHDPSLAAGEAALGKQIVISQPVKLGDGSVLPPGRYTLMPARYAMLDGAFLVRAVAGSQTLAEGASVGRTDGSVTLGARLADAGSSFTDAQPSTWQVMSKGIALKYSEIRSTSASKFFADLATKAGVAAPQLPRDGGSLVIRAQQADLQGQGRFAAGKDAQGQTGSAGSLEIDATAIEVHAGTTAPTGDGVLHLSAAQLNQYGGGTVILGGTTAGAADDGTRIQVRANSVVFDQGADALTVSGLVAVATQDIDVRDGAVFTPAPRTGSATPVQYVIEGNGAAMRIDASAGAGLTRTGTSSDTSSSLSVGQGAAFHAAQGSLVLDSSGNSHIDRRATLRAADALISGQAMVIGARGPVDDKLGLTPAQLAALGTADHLTLRAYDRMSFVDGASLGSASLDSLVLDTPVLDVNQASGGAQVTAGSVMLTNTTARAPGVLPGGTGQLSVNATTAEGGSGELRLGAGHVAVAGAAQLNLSADRGISLVGTGQLVASNQVTMQAPAITAAEAAASHSIQTTGEVRIIGSGATPQLELFDGGAFSVNADSVDMRGRIVMPSGQVSLQGEHGVHLSAGARINTAGRSITLDNQVVEQAGGQVTLGSAAGNVALDAGSSVDVSGAGRTGRGGSLNLQAAMGEVRFEGALIGRTGDDAIGASLAIDAGRDLRLTQLSQKIEGQFTDSLQLRQREGDMTVAPVVALKARNIDIAADAGQLTVAGTLDATGAEAGRITLSARDDLNVGQGAQLLARTDTAGANGGRVALNSSQGQIRLIEGSLIDVHAGAATDTVTPDGGRVELRALQHGNNVAISALNGEIVGASRIDVQAVKVYDNVSTISNFTDGSTLGRARIEHDAARFIGFSGENAERIAERLLAGNPSLAGVLKIHAEAEVRSNGDLKVTSGADWALPTESINTGNQFVGDTSLTLRASGNLYLGRGISSGLSIDPWGYSLGVPTSDNGGSVRLVAGADLKAARVDSTGTAAHELTLAAKMAHYYPLYDSYTYSFTGSSTGDLTLAASGDIDIAHAGTRLQTTGTRIDAETQAVLDVFADFEHGGDLPRPEALFGGRNGGTVQLVAGGNIRSVAGQPEISGYGYDGVGSWDGRHWAFDNSLLWSNHPERLNRGVIAGGGGAIDVRAGGDVLNLVAVAPSSGYRLETGTASGSAEERHFSGGSVRVEAGRDIVDGMYESGGAELTLRAGRDITYRTEPGSSINQVGTRVYYENNDIHIDARRNVDLAKLSARFANYESALNGSNIQGLDGDARAQVTAIGGYLSLNNLAQSTGNDIGLMLLPDRTHLAAPSGSIDIAAQLLQQPQNDGELTVLAGHHLSMHDSLTVNATQTSQRTGAWWQTQEESDLEKAGLMTDGPTLLDQSNRTPVQFVAGDGDLAFDGSGGVLSARPLRLVAGGDLYLSGTISAQHQPRTAESSSLSEQTLLHAGRDIVFHDSKLPGAFGQLQIAGPGEGLLLAGRDIDLGALTGTSGSGVMAVGNTTNILLPSGSSALTLVAGLRGDGTDYAQAVGRGFAVVGSSALAQRAGDVYALLSAKDAGSLTLGSAAAQAFDALGTTEQLAAVKTLMGAAAYDQALAQYVRSLPGNAQLSDSAALAKFSKMTPARQDAAPGALLSGQFATASADVRHSFLAQVAAADTPRQAQALQRWMKLTTGQTLSLDQAIVAFESLPVERQIGWLNQMLVEEVRTAGRAAATATGVDKEAAYLRGYLAIDSIFPGLRPEGDIRMPSTQVKTVQHAGAELVAQSQQGGITQRSIDLNAITLVTPGGAVNAGEVGATDQSPNNLGVVTVAGGDIAAIAKHDFLVNQSRVFSLERGDILLWSSEGDIDAGRGAKTVTGAPAPVLRLDPLTGRLYLDTSGSFTGSGIAVLNEDSDLDLYAPKGAIDAGEAGIRARGNVFLGAVVVRGADNFQVGGSVAGSSIGTVPVSLPAVVAPVPAEAQGGGTDDEDERRKRLRARRQLLLDFLGYGRG
ncbi:filamentous hemagglutinin family protein [Ideonella sp. DXS29W]|uniref:Filamentous hemagglutinin family protein n=1 Tax=Ideonella lacteola TaxID=2984193 RepID=A0ABU9BRV4_9BURK